MTADPAAGDHVRRNRQGWERDSEAYQERNASQLNRWDRLAWGVYDAPEDDVHALGDVDGLDVLEYGCGACQFGIKVAMRGAQVTGLDFSHAQLRQGLANMAQTGVAFPVVEADGERTPFADASFDLVCCDHGVMGFADPYATVPEVARLLRPGGRFVFNGTTPFIWTVWGEGDEPAGTELKRSYFGPRRWDHDDDDGPSADFQLPYGGWIRLFRANGFVVEDLIELRPDADATTTYDGYASLEWARRFPAEQIWKVRRT
ncbi:MAG: methyltransferase domain-containing protein [Actinobacteria bacterium]|nr:methyltransferase domain-containing protein [Actinomycetota bacterium]